MTAYWIIVAVAGLLAVLALVYLSMAHPEPAVAVSGALVSGYETTSNTYDAHCVGRMVLRDDHRLLVRVDGGPDGRSATFIVDTAYDVNVMSQSLDARWPDEQRPEEGGRGSVTVMGSHAMSARERPWPPGLRIGNCQMPMLQQRTIVLADHIFPPGVDGILGRSFLRAPSFVNVLLDIPAQKIHFNVDPRRVAHLQQPHCDFRTTERDPKYGMFVVETQITPNRGGPSISARLVLDTGAPRLVLGRRVMQRHPQWARLGEPGTLNMSGQQTDTRVVPSSIRIQDTSLRGADVPVSIIQPSETLGSGSLLDSEDVDGLLGVACLRQYRILWDNENGGSLLFFCA